MIAGSGSSKSSSGRFVAILMNLWEIETIGKTVEWSELELREKKWPYVQDIGVKVIINYTNAVTRVAWSAPQRCIIRFENLNESRETIWRLRWDCGICAWCNIINIAWGNQADFVTDDSDLEGPTKVRIHIVSFYHMLQSLLQSHRTGPAGSPSVCRVLFQRIWLLYSLSPMVAGCSTACIPGSWSHIF